MDFDRAYADWIRALTQGGFAVETFLNPPASDPEITAFEESIGFAIPSDLRALYRRANGQKASFKISDPKPGTIMTPFFGLYDFVSLEKALQTYRGWLDIYVSAGDSFASDFDHCTAREGNPVFGEYWRPGWTAFSLDGGGNSYAVDLSPAPGGVYGQVIAIGSDEDERRVPARSMTELLAKAAATIDVSLATKGESTVWRCFDLESP
ncbi:MAG TPA: SMI1/KNR4 family protein [Stellaceae bacterium]|nr:SMI1/KNR4 family protein [Stellaceae bacterium]